MNRLALYQPISNLASAGLSVRTNHDLKLKTLMKMQTRAAAYVTVETPYALKKLMREVSQREIPTFLLGAGANTLFATSYFDGVVFQLGKSFTHCDYLGGHYIRLGAGVPLATAIRFSHRCRLMGLEFLTKVPGTIGGSLAGNAGAGEYSLCQFVERVYLMTRDGFIACVNRDQFRYSYRFSELREAIIMEADFRLEPYNSKKVNESIENYVSKKKGQPYHMPSCGCIFKNHINPDGTVIPAGKLIDEAGLKGYSIRGAMVSEGHANFFVNTGDASGEDFLALISLVRDIVFQKTGIELKLEAQIVGGPLNSVILK